MVSALEAKKTIERALFEIKGVVGVGLERDTETIKVYVEKATPEIKSSVHGRAAGFEVIIVEIGELRPHGTIPLEANPAYRQAKHDHLYGGISAGHYRITAGTLGAVIVDDDTGKLGILSNNHVFANTDTITDNRANKGDRILQPGPYDGGTLFLDTVATLERWVPFDLENENYVDAAFGVVIDQEQVYPNVLGTGISGVTYSLVGVKGIATTPGNITVRKYGRTTGFTEGRVVDLDFTALGNYDLDEKILITDQLLVDIYADSGDSGSLLIDKENYAVGLICLKSETTDGHSYAVASKMHNVAALLGLTMAESGDSQVELPEFPISEMPQEPTEPSILRPVLIAVGLGISACLLGSVFFSEHSR